MSQCPISHSGRTPAAPSQGQPGVDSVSPQLPSRPILCSGSRFHSSPAVTSHHLLFSQHCAAIHAPRGSPAYPQHPVWLHLPSSQRYPANDRPHRMPRGLHSQSRDTPGQRSSRELCLGRPPLTSLSNFSHASRHTAATGPAALLSTLPPPTWSSFCSGVLSTLISAQGQDTNVTLSLSSYAPPTTFAAKH